jgi:hypothetical protein
MARVLRMLHGATATTTTSATAAVEPRAVRQRIPPRRQSSGRRGTNPSTIGRTYVAAARRAPTATSWRAVGTRPSHGRTTRVHARTTTRNVNTVSRWTVAV